MYAYLHRYDASRYSKFLERCGNVPNCSANVLDCLMLRRISNPILWRLWQCLCFSLSFQEFIGGILQAEHQPEPWENNPDYEDPEDYLNDEDQFNITNRLTVLFPLLDTNPHDGFVSVTELQDWHMLQGHKGIQHRTDREMEVHDKNHDGLVTFEEYLPNLTKEELGDSNDHQH